MLTEGTNVTLTYVDDGDNAGTLTINVPDASATEQGVIELATGDEARAGTNNALAMTPLRVEQVLVDKASDVDPLDVGSTAIGTSTNFARGDHAHGGGGSSSAGDAYAFTATLADIADIASGTAYANLTSGLTAGELVNEGSGFTIETAASRDKLVITNAGTYLVTASLIGSADAVATGVDRGALRARIARERSAVITALAPEGTPTYARNQYEDFSQRLGSAVSGIYEFEAGDKIEIQGLYEGQGTSTVQFNLVGARSGISIVSVGAGPKGDQGDPRSLAGERSSRMMIRAPFPLAQIVKERQRTHHGATTTTRLPRRPPRRPV